MYEISEMCKEWVEPYRPHITEDVARETELSMNE
jgi:hypothetical protein